MVQPAFGMKGVWVSEYVAESVRGSGHTIIDNMSMLLTHVSEVLRNNLAQLLSYRDLRALLDRLEPEYQRLLEELSFAASDCQGQTITVDKAFVDQQLSELSQDEDLSRFIL